MRNFDLYVSGILYGRLRLGDGTPQIRKLDVHTGVLLDWQDLTEQDRDFYRFFVKMDFAAPVSYTHLTLPTTSRV